MHLHLLGGLEVVMDGRYIRVDGRKERLLLALLAIHVGRELDQDRLIEALWATDPPRTAIKSLHSHVWRLRGALGTPAEPAPIVSQHRGYKLTLRPEQVDIHAVAGLAERARRLVRDGDHAAAVSVYDEALGWWRGRSLGDLAALVALAGEAARLDELRTSLIEERVDCLLALGQHTTLVSPLEALCAEHPLRERLVAQRMLALYRCARQSEALEAFQVLRRHLRDDLGLEPSPDLVDLEHAILGQDESLGWAQGASPASLDPDRAARVMIVDDHPVWRQALRVLLEREAGVVVVAEASDGTAALNALAGAAPSLVVMDLNLTGMGGVEATRRLVAAIPEVRVLVLSASEDQADVLAAVRAGAHGYVLKTGSAREVVEAVQRVLAGEPVFSPSLASVVLGQLRRMEPA